MTDRVEEIRQLCDELVRCGAQFDMCCSAAERNELDADVTKTKAAIVAEVERLSRERGAQGLFTLGSFTLHNGQVSRWKIECDALTAADWGALAVMAAPIVGRFQRVEPVPGTNAEKFAAALRREVEAEVGAPLLLVDDVLTTGGSMERQRAGREAVGIVAFARGPSPSWIVPLFTWQAESDLAAARERNTALTEALEKVLKWSKYRRSTMNLSVELDEAVNAAAALLREGGIDP